MQLFSHSRLGTPAPVPIYTVAQAPRICHTSRRSFHWQRTTAYAVNPPVEQGDDSSTKGSVSAIKSIAEQSIDPPVPETARTDANGQIPPPLVSVDQTSQAIDVSETFVTESGLVEVVPHKEAEVRAA